MRKAIERIVTSEPVDSMAARVMQRGETWEPDIRDVATFIRSADPIPTRTFTGPRHQDLTGTRFGRLLVTGWFGTHNPKKPSLWVCRCACGDYELRRSRAVTNLSNAADACKDCRHLEFLKRRDSQGLTAKPGWRR